MNSEYRAESREFETPFGGGEISTDEMASAASRLREIERLRRLYVDHALVANPRWDILLSLYLGARDGAGVTLASLSAANRIAEENCESFVEELVEAGLARLMAPQRPGGSPPVILADLGKERMDAFLRSCGRA